MGNDVEGEGDEALFARIGLARMLHGANQQLIADALSLLAGCNKQVRPEPKPTAHLTQGKADHRAIILGQPHAA